MDRNIESKNEAFMKLLTGLNGVKRIAAAAPFNDTDNFTRETRYLRFEQEINKHISDNKPLDFIVAERMINDIKKESYRLDKIDPEGRQRLIIEIDNE